eukprot:11202626-Lingulodinium_polyedra.AAC.1
MARVPPRKVAVMEVLAVASATICVQGRAYPVEAVAAIGRRGRLILEGMPRRRSRSTARPGRRPG